MVKLTCSMCLAENNQNNYHLMQLFTWQSIADLFLFFPCWISCGEDRLLCLHVQQVYPGSPCLSAGQNCEWTDESPPLSFVIKLLMTNYNYSFKNRLWDCYLDIVSLFFPLAPSLVRRCPLTLNVTSRRCLGMCWMRSSKPSLSADCVRQPQGAHDPSMPPPSLAETQHNHVMKTLRLALSVSPYLLVLRFARFLSWPSSSVSHTLLFLRTLSSVITP